METIEKSPVSTTIKPVVKNHSTTTTISLKPKFQKLDRWYWIGIGLFASVILFWMIFANTHFQQTINTLYAEEPKFSWFVFIGFLAQMIDGAFGMAYGVTVGTSLMALGFTPAMASASMHAAEIISTGSSAAFYMKHRNINKKLFKALLIPGILGAVTGTTLIALVSKEQISFVKPFVATYTLVLGVLILKKALFTNNSKKKKIQNVFPIALMGGFFDSVGSGGWGPIVTSSLVAGGRNLRYSIGSAHLTRFFVATASTIMFVFLIGFKHWLIVFGLILGGLVAAPISIAVSNKIPVKAGLIIIGIMVILISLKNILAYFH